MVAHSGVPAVNPSRARDPRASPAVARAAPGARRAAVARLAHLRAVPGEPPAPVGAPAAALAAAAPAAALAAGIPALAVAPGVACPAPAAALAAVAPAGEPGVAI